MRLTQWCAVGAAAFFQQEASQALTFLRHGVTRDTPTEGEVPSLGAEAPPEFDATDLVEGIKPEDIQADPSDLLGSGDEMDGAIPDLSDAAVPEVPVGTDLEKVGLDMAEDQAKEMAEPLEDGESPTYAPLDGHPEETYTTDDAVNAVSDVMAGEKDVVDREGMADCDCACCMSVGREIPSQTSNWTCTTVPDYLAAAAPSVADGVLPPADMGEPIASAKCNGVTTATGGQCAARGHGKDTDEPKEALAHELFCSTHCKAVEEKDKVPCLGLSDGELASAWHDHAWTDPLVPSVQEAQRMAYNAATALDAPPPTPHLQKVADLRTAKKTLEDLGPPIAAAEEALVNSGGAATSLIAS